MEVLVILLISFSNVRLVFLLAVVAIYTASSDVASYFAVIFAHNSYRTL